MIKRKESIRLNRKCLSLALRYAEEDRAIYLAKKIFNLIRREIKRVAKDARIC